MKSPLFIGCATALVTPFRGGEVDREAFIRILHRQIEGGADALVVCGTTGESPTLTDKEKQWLFTTAVREVRASDRPALPVVAGTGSNNTRRAVELSRLAEDCGVDGLLVVTPYYNKTSEAGLIGHYEAITAATSLPTVVYHVPSRTGCRLTPQTCKVLSENPRIAGLKDATGDISFTAKVAALCGAALPIYAGNDDQTVPVLSLGGQGVISVVSNLFPARMSRLCRLWREGRCAEAAAEQIAMIPLCEALFCEVNPIPVKAGLSMLGLCEDEVRLPLAPADTSVRVRVREALKGL
ncbi:MAG: 4-hydroxy-tetrahydrodipicolinate synthase [Ruminococcaceae bacterium]|nr:4-hydroxy-tetrahydrodipicolinate synthase [Oscillospiraceae bacterium]